MTLQEEIVFRVPDISLYPRFSLDRHKPQSRLHNFHSLDYDEEMFIDLSYCDKSFNKIFNSSTQGIYNSSCLGVTLSDFSNLIANRKGSTSTPFREATKPDLAKDNHFESIVFRKPRLVSLSEDSGFIESSVAHTFAQSCIISSPSTTRRGKRPRESVNCYPLTCGLSEEEFSSQPLPCLSLEKRFENLQSDSDNSNDSSDISFVNKLEAEKAKNAEEIYFSDIEGSYSVASLQKGISSASSGYGSLSSQSSNAEIHFSSQSSHTSNAEIDFSSQTSSSKNSEGRNTEQSEQVVPVIEISRKVDICDFYSNDKTLGTIFENRKGNEDLSEIKTETNFEQNSLSKRIAKVLQEVSPKDPQRVIGRKIGLEKVDIIGELKSRNILPALKVLFSHVSDADLSTLCCVSSAWNDAVCADVESNSRRLKSRSSQVLVTEKVCLCVFVALLYRYDCV